MDLEYDFELTEADVRKMESTRRARQERAKREREWEAVKPGVNFLMNSDSAKYMKKIKEEAPEDFTSMLRQAKSEGKNFEGIVKSCAEIRKKLGEPFDTKKTL